MNNISAKRLEEILAEKEKLFDSALKNHDGNLAYYHGQCDVLGDILIEIYEGDAARTREILKKITGGSNA